jgi:hypothetical protein
MMMRTYDRVIRGRRVLHYIIWQVRAGHDKSRLPGMIWQYRKKM